MHKMEWMEIFICLRIFRKLAALEVDERYPKVHSEKRWLMNLSRKRAPRETIHSPEFRFGFPADLLRFFCQAYPNLQIVFGWLNLYGDLYEYFFSSWFPKLPNFQRKPVFHKIKGDSFSNEKRSEKSFQLRRVFVNWKNAIRLALFAVIICFLFPFPTFFHCKFNKIAWTQKL